MDALDPAQQLLQHRHHLIQRIRIGSHNRHAACSQLSAQRGVEAADRVDVVEAEATSDLLHKVSTARKLNSIGV